MGLALYRQHRYEELQKHWGPLFTFYCARRDIAAETAPDTGESATWQGSASRTWDNMNAPDAVYRDTHYILEHLLPTGYIALLTAHITIVRNAEDEKEPTLTPDATRAVLDVVAALPRPRRHDARERYDWLISFLRGAIDANDPIICSW